ncbi:MAG: ester cyclase [Chloroflexota bacterium]
MSVEKNKALVRRFLEEFASQGDLSKTDELLAPNFTLYHPAMPGPVDIEGAKQALTMFRTAFPNFKIVVEDLIGEGEKVVARFKMSATHQGDFMGIAPTGKQVSMAGIGFYRLEGGKIVEDRVVEDMLGLMQQLGVVPM